MPTQPQRTIMLPPQVIALLLVLISLCLPLAGCEDTDIGLAIDAGGDAVKAVTLSDEDVREMAAAVARQMDAEHTLAPSDSTYASRLNRVAGSRLSWRGQTYKARVYLSPQVNAFALADGSIRIFSGLMDLMDDQELRFVLGHEMGHVLEEHVKEKIRLAYASSAVRKAIASQRGEAGQIAGSLVGALAEAVVNAQFSQAEERQADDYGLVYLLEQGGGKESAISALHKLATLGGGHTFLSSHPAPGDRAERLNNNPIPTLPTGDEPSLFQRILAWLKGLWPFGKEDQ